jgi:ABC-type uncharacterized transport system ATPase subunit
MLRGGRRMNEIGIRMEKLTRDSEAEKSPVTAVDGVTLEVPAGTIFGFLGPNGAGKTAMIRPVLGLLEPTIRSIPRVCYCEPIQTRGPGRWADAVRRALFARGWPGAWLHLVLYAHVTSDLTVNAKLMVVSDHRYCPCGQEQR